MDRGVFPVFLLYQSFRLFVDPGVIAGNSRLFQCIASQIQFLTLTVTIFITGNGIYQLSRYITHGTIQRGHIFCCPYLEGSASYRVFA